MSFSSHTTFEDQKHVGQLSDCVCARACTWASDSVASSDKSPAGSTSLWEEGKPRQCGTGGGGRLERGRWAVGEVLEDSRAAARPDGLLVRMQICAAQVFCAVNKGQAVLGSLARTSSRVLAVPSDLRGCSALTHSLMGCHHNSIQWFQDGQWRPPKLKNTSYTSPIRKQMMVFFLRFQR